MIYSTVLYSTVIYSTVLYCICNDNLKMLVFPNILAKLFCVHKINLYNFSCFFQREIFTCFEFSWLVKITKIVEYSF